MKMVLSSGEEQALALRQELPVQALLVGQLSKNTQRTYRAALGDFFESMGAMHIEEVTRDHIIGYRNYLMERYAPATVALRLSVLSQLFEEARLRGIVEENPVKAVKRPRVPSESTTQGLTAKEATALLATCDCATVKGARDYAILRLMLYTGLRRSEVVNASWGDLRQERGHWVLCVVGKGGRLRKAKVQVSVKRALDEYLEMGGRALTADSPLFVATQHNRGEVPLSPRTVAQIVKRRAKRAGITKRITPHSLRHTAVTLALDGGATVRQAQYLAGHADPKTTMRYDRNRENLDDHASDYIRISEVA